MSLFYIDSVQCHKCNPKSTVSNAKLPFYDEDEPWQQSNNFKFGKMVICRYCIKSHMDTCQQCKKRTLMSSLYHVTINWQLDTTQNTCRFIYNYYSYCIECVHKWIEYKDIGQLVITRINNITAEKFIKRLQKTKIHKQDQLKEELLICKKQLDEHIINSNCLKKQLSFEYPIVHAESFKKQSLSHKQHKPALSDETERKLHILAQIGAASITVVSKVIDSEYKRVVEDLKMNLQNMKTSYDQLNWMQTDNTSQFANLNVKIQEDIHKYEQIVNEL